MAADYLTNLVERTLGRGPTAGPLIRPMFAPGPPLAANQGADTFDPAPPGRDSDLPTPQSLFAPSMPRPSMAIAGRSEAATHARGVLAAPEPAGYPELATEVVRRRVPLRAAADVERPRSTSLDEEAPLVSDARQTSAAHPLGAAVHGDPFGGDRRRAGAATNSGRRALEVEASMRTTQAPSEAPLLADGEFDRQAPSPRSGRIMPAAAYRGELASLRARARQAGAAQDGAPVIRVTIGRVEVRAVMPPAERAPRPAYSSKSRALSLEDYLRQRNSGER